MGARDVRNPAGGRGSRGNSETISGNSLAQPGSNSQLTEGAFSSRRRFLIWACMAGFVGPERVTERILAELDEVQR
jgi:hypothetical protein